MRPPMPTGVVPWTVPSVMRHRLPSGTTVLLQPDRTDPVVAMSFLCRAGAAFEPDDRDGLAALTADSLVRVPGERRGNLRAKHTEFGVEAPQSLLESIAALSS